VVINFELLAAVHQQPPNSDTRVGGQRHAASRVKELAIKFQQHICVCLLSNGFVGLATCQADNALRYINKLFTGGVLLPELHLEGISDTWGSGHS
jgi:hypothetical protein